MRRATVAGLAAAALCGIAVPAWAHSFDQRYDLPLPLGYFVAAAVAVVALTFVVSALFARRDAGDAEPVLVIPLGPASPFLSLFYLLCRGLSLGLFFLAIAAGLLGSADPLMNLAPTLIWIVWWVGLSLLVACVGNVWPALDPWRSLFDCANALARWQGRREGIEMKRPYPPSVGAWPAVALLLLWSWLELVYPLATVPARVAWAALAWSVISLAGMVTFGREIWQRNVDPFAVYFSVLGRFAPLAVVPAASGGRNFLLCTPGAGLLHDRLDMTASAGFVMAMLATVLFDGLHASAGWLLIDAALGKAVPWLLDANGYVAGTLGLIGLWLVFVAAYWLCCLVTARLVGAGPMAKADERVTASSIARRYAWTLVPIAVGYNIAHNFSGLLIQGQNVIALLSDPFGRGWDLFGTGRFYPDIGLIDAKAAWYVALVAIVAGHVIAVWLAHHVALRQFAAPRQAALACLPLTALMLGYTAFSLSVIAEPMIRFVPEPAQAVLH